MKIVHVFCWFLYENRHATTGSQRKSWKERWKLHNVIRQEFLCEIRRENVTQILSVPMVCNDFSAYGIHSLMSYIQIQSGSFEVFKVTLQEPACFTDDTSQIHRAPPWPNSEFKKKTSELLDFQKTPKEYTEKMHKDWGCFGGILGYFWRCSRIR